MEFLKRAESWLVGLLHEGNGLPVVYQHEGLTYPVTANVGSTTFDETGTDGIALQWQTRDFFVRTVDMPFEPKRGDKVFEVIDGVERVFEVVEPCWQWSGQYRTWRQIFTKETRVA